MKSGYKSVSFLPAEQGSHTAFMFETEIAAFAAASGIFAHCVALRRRTATRVQPIDRSPRRNEKDSVVMRTSSLLSGAVGKDFLQTALSSA